MRKAGSERAGLFLWHRSSNRAEQMSDPGRHSHCQTAPNHDAPDGGPLWRTAQLRAARAEQYQRQQRHQGNGHAAQPRRRQNRPLPNNRPSLNLPQLVLSHLRPIRGLQPRPPGSPPAANYTGRIYLMSPSSLSQGRLESVWEVLDQVAGSGNITDTRLVSRQAGVQFTPDLGVGELNIDALQSKFSDATMVALEEGRLRIEWPS